MKSKVPSLCLVTLTLVLTGCGSGGPPMSQVSGMVTFQGNPVPAGNVMFTPDVSVSGGQVRMFTVTEGRYDSSKDPSPGLKAGLYEVTIMGYDGKRIPRFFQGKQIFNAYKESMTVQQGTANKDFAVPDSAGIDVKVFETGDF